MCSFSIRPDAVAQETKTKQKKHHQTAQRSKTFTHPQAP